MADFAALAFTSTTDIQCREFLIRSCAWDRVLFLTDKVALIFPIAFSPTEHRFGKISILLSIIIFTDIF